MHLKRRKKYRFLTPEEELYVARQLYLGTNFKEIGYQFNISVSYVHKIFHKYLSWRIEWKEPPPN